MIDLAGCGSPPLPAEEQQPPQAQQQQQPQAAAAVAAAAMAESVGTLTATAASSDPQAAGHTAGDAGSSGATAQHSQQPAGEGVSQAGRARHAAAHDGAAGQGSSPYACTASMLISHRGPQFLATTRALLLRLTAANLEAGDIGLASTCVHLRHRVYWQMIDSMPHIAERLQPDEDDEPLLIRLTHPASGEAWEVPLQFSTNGLRFEPLIFVLVLEAIGADQPGNWFLLELDAEQCSQERLVGTIRCVDGSYPVASLPGSLLKPVPRRGNAPDFRHHVCRARLEATVKGVKASQEGRSSSSEEPQPQRHKSPLRLAWGGVHSVLSSLLKQPAVQQVFGVPVNVQAYPDYPTVVAQPMDLGTIQMRLKDGWYASPLLFRDDVRLVWSNCRLYNPPGDWVRELGNRTSHQFEQQWECEGVERHWREHLAQQQAAAAAAAPAGKAPWAARGGQVSARTAAAAAVPLPYVPTPEQATGPLPAALIASPVQHNLTMHAPPAQQPAASEVAAAAAAAGVAAATSGGSSAAGPAKAGWPARADSIMQMRLADAMVALGEADDQPPSWRRALRKLRLAGMGGATLETILSGWEHLPQQPQQAVYDEAVMAVFEEDWERLQARLQRELDAAIEGVQAAGSG